MHLNETPKIWSYSQFKFTKRKFVNPKVQMHPQDVIESPNTVKWPAQTNTGYEPLGWKMTHKI